MEIFVHSLVSSLVLIEQFLIVLIDLSYVVTKYEKKVTEELNVNTIKLLSQEPFYFPNHVSLNESIGNAHDFG